MTDIFSIKHEEWHAIVDGVLIDATFNSKGAALAAIKIERNRRLRRNIEKLKRRFYKNNKLP